MRVNYHVPDPDSLTANPVCAAPCAVELTACNIINGDTVHKDCRCLYRECRQPLLAVLDWRRQICNDCWSNPKHDVSKVKLGATP
jgi:hypothetical protein